jgi:HAE1 family hydrophobic/amphiphilic exporter-1
MSFTGLFIRRPVATFILMAALLGFGLLGYRNLPVNNLPNVDFPTIVVSASLPGASPDTMASAVATPLEKQFSTIAGIDSMTSTSTQGSTQITLQFVLDRSIDAAAQDVQAAITKTLPQLPPDMTIPPVYQKVNPSDSPIILFALSSPTLPLSTLDDYGENLLGQNISMVKDVAQVLVYGAQKYAVRIQLNPQALAAKGISVAQVAAAAEAANSNLPTGALWGRDVVTTVETDAPLQKAADFRPVIVDYRNGSLVRIQDLGNVIDGVQNDKVAAWYRDARAVVLAVQRQPGSNTVEVADNVKAIIDKLKSRLPAAVDVRILFDRAAPIRASVHDVKLTLLLTLFLVVMIIFLFLRNFSATIIPSLALPLSIVGTFGVMYYLNYTLDNLSLMALTLATGFVVDDAVVMLENIVRHREMGESQLQAAYHGAKEIEFTIVSMTVSLVAVFIPLLLMGGIIGRLFREFAVTITIAILMSGFVSLTLSPMLCSQFLGASAMAHHGRFYAVTERGWLAFARFYEVTLAWVMRHRPATVVFSVLVMIGTVLLAMISNTGFLPSEDNDMLMGTTEAVAGTSFESMARHQSAASDILLADANVEGFMSSVGAGGPNSLYNQGRIFIHLKPRSQRRLSADQVADELRPKLAQIIGLRCYLINPPSINVGGRISKALYQYTLLSTNTDQLFASAGQLEQALHNSPSLQDVTSDLSIRNPQITLKINRDKAAALGVTPAAIENTLFYAYSARQISTIFTPTDQYWVILELAPEFQRDPQALNMLYVASATGGVTPLSELVTAENSVGPLAINHSGQIPSVTISFNLKTGASLSQATGEVEAAAKRILPASITAAFSGSAQAFKGSQGNLGILLLLAVAVIYMVLAILYESFIHPLTILSGLPFAGFGALLTLWLFKVDLNVYSLVGVIMLIGVVKKNAIMMIDFAIGAQKGGATTPAEAITKAAAVRFRPIMMTTMAAFMGTLPIALGLGAGGEARQPLGLAVVGGLAFSQFVTLYITPVFYTYFDRLQRRVGARIEERASGGDEGGQGPVTEPRPE